MDIENIKSIESENPKTDNIMEEFVSFEVAKLLKEKGFNERTEFLYENEKTKLIESYVTNSMLGPECCSAPTQQVALRWLREIHKINITVTPNLYETTFAFDVYKQGIDGWERMEGDTDLVYTGEDPLWENYPTYEEAANNGIKYVLKIIK